MLFRSGVSWVPSSGKKKTRGSKMKNCFFHSHTFANGSSPGPVPDTAAPRCAASCSQRAQQRRLESAASQGQARRTQDRRVVSLDSRRRQCRSRYCRRRRRSPSDLHLSFANCRRRAAFRGNRGAPPRGPGTLPRLGPPPRAPRRGRPPKAKVSG